MQRVEISFIGSTGEFVRNWEEADFVETEKGPFLSIDIPDGAEVVQIRKAGKQQKPVLRNAEGEK